jgi:hypothetical protein
MAFISKHIDYSEVTRSRTARRYGINNEPNERQLKVIRHLAVNLFEPLRLELGGHPLFISSFFRSERLNRKLSGAARASDHMVLRNTAAIDLDQDVFPASPVSNNDIFKTVFECFRYYKLIAEFPDNNGLISWVHISYSTYELNNGEKNTYIAVWRNGRRRYLPYIGNEHLIKI